MPMHTGQVCVFGGAPNFVLQPQNSFVSVSKLHVDFQADDEVVVEWSGILETFAVK